MNFSGLFGWFGWFPSDFQTISWISFDVSNFDIYPCILFHLRSFPTSSPYQFRYRHIKSISKIRRKKLKIFTRCCGWWWCCGRFDFIINIFIEIRLFAGYTVNWCTGIGCISLFRFPQLHVCDKYVSLFIRDDE